MWPEEVKGEKRGGARPQAVRQRAGVGGEGRASPAAFPHRPNPCRWNAELSLVWGFELEVIRASSTQRFPTP